MTVRIDRLIQASKERARLALIPTRKGVTRDEYGKLSYTPEAEAKASQPAQVARTHANMPNECPSCHSRMFVVNWVRYGMCSTCAKRKGVYKA